MIVLLVIFWLPISSFANPCLTIPDLKIEKRIPVPNDVNYFMRSAPSTGELGFATNRGNRMLDAKTERLSVVPGNIDPVITPDGKFLAIPQEWIYDPQTKKFVLPGTMVPEFKISNQRVLVRLTGTKEYGVSLGSADEARRSGKSYQTQLMTFYWRENGVLERKYADESVQFNYQSLGTLSETKKETNYRLLFESAESFAIRDYQWDSQQKVFSPTGNPLPLCPGMHGGLPALNKSGDEFSALDIEEGITNVYAIGKSGNKCEIVETIPFLVGKMDFSPDGTRLAMHVDQRSDSRIFDQPDQRNKLEVFIYDRKTKIPMAVATSPDEDAYYPVFLSNDRIAFMSANKPKKKEDKEFFVNIVALKEGPSRKCENCYNAKTKIGQMAALIGALKMSRCTGQSKYLFRSAMTGFSRIPPDICSEVVSTCNEECFKKRVVEVKNSIQKGGFSVGGKSLNIPEPWSKEILDQISLSDLKEFCRDYQRVNANRELEPEDAKSNFPAY